MREWRGNMAEVAEICGEDLTEKLADLFAGTQIYVPKKPKAKSLPGLPSEMVQSLAAAFGGDTLTVPSRRSSHTDTAEEIEAYYDAGLTIKEIARKLGYTESWVMRVRKRSGKPRLRDIPDPRQMNMFE